ncbi:MAG TPA: ABC transporter permease [Trebonia sp.]
MTAVTLPPQEATAPPAGRRPGLRATTRVELAKLTAQWPLRIVLVLCVIAPIGFALYAKSQWPSGPSDTLFGRWSSSTGFATSLTLLNDAAVYGVPLLAGLFAGDIFAGEDRHGTWKMILTRSSSRTSIFVGKALAAAICVWAAFIAIGIASLIAGVGIVGGSPLVGLSGQLVSGGQAWGLVAASWLFSLLPATAFIALGLLLSIASRSTIVGVLGPLVIAGGLILLESVDSGTIVRTVSPGTPLDAWHSLLIVTGGAGTLIQGAVSSIIWTAIFGGAALVLLRRRAFASSDTTPRLQRRATIRLAVIAVAAGVVLIGAAGLGPTNLTAERLQASIGPVLARLSAVRYQWQTGTPGQANTPMTATCNRGDGTQRSSGAGDDWACVVVDSNPADGAQPVTFDVTLKPNGCYTAEAGSAFGALLVTDEQGRAFINPVYAFDGCFGTP